MKDSIISYLPDNTILYAHIASLSRDEKITDFFADQITEHLKIPKEDIFNKIFPFVGQEAAIAILQDTNETAPFFIFTKPNHQNDGINLPAQAGFPAEWKNITIENSTQKKLIILSENNNEFKKFQDNSNFKNSAQIKKFTINHAPDLTFYVDINKIHTTGNVISIFDNAILKEMLDKKEILAGVKKINDFYEIVISDLSQNIFSKIKLRDEYEKKYDENIIFSAKTNISNKIPALPEEFLKNFFNLENGKIEITIAIKPQNLQKNNSDDSLHNQLILNGENSACQYIISQNNNTKNRENLEKIKTFFINYLNEKLPEEKIVKLPDKTFMTELWSNPKRFIFKKNENSPIYSLKNTQLNFEFAYSETENIILLSNSINALKDYLSNKTNSATADMTDQETFFINTKKLKDESLIINALNYFGNYADGRLIKTP